MLQVDAGMHACILLHVTIVWACGKVACRRCQGQPASAIAIDGPRTLIIDMHTRLIQLLTTHLCQAKVCHLGNEADGVVFCGWNLLEQHVFCFEVCKQHTRNTNR